MPACLELENKCCENVLLPLLYSYGTRPHKSSTPSPQTLLFSSLFSSLSGCKMEQFKWFICALVHVSQNWFHFLMPDQCRLPRQEESGNKVSTKSRCLHGTSELVKKTCPGYCAICPWTHTFSSHQTPPVTGRHFSTKIPRVKGTFQITFSRLKPWIAVYFEI